MMWPEARKIPHTRLVLAFTVAAQCFVLAQAGDRFENPTAGIAVTRPAGWQTTSLQTLQENRARVRLADPELQAALQTRATAPLYVFSKYAEPHPALNPSIQITLRPAGSLAGMSATALLKGAVATMQRALPDFRFLTPIRATRVSGWPAAHLRASYTLTSTAGATYPVITRIWLIPRGSFMFLVGMSGPPDGPDASEQEFKQALASLEIQR